MSSERDERRAFPTDRELSRMAEADERERAEWDAYAKSFPVDTTSGDENFETTNPHD